MQINVWVLRTDWKKKKKSEGWWMHNWMSRVLWFMHLTENFSLCPSVPLSKKSWGVGVTATSRLDEGKMNVLHSLYWPWSCSSLLTRPIFRRISPLKKKKKWCVEKASKNWESYFPIHLKCQGKQTSAQCRWLGWTRKPACFRPCSRVLRGEGRLPIPEAYL